MDAIYMFVIVFGLLLIFLGYYLRENTSWVKKRNVFTPKNCKSLCNRIGLIILIFGFEMTLFPLGNYFFNGLELKDLGLFAFFHLFLIIGAFLLDLLDM